MSNSVAQQWRQTEKPIEPQGANPWVANAGPIGTGYAARGALGPGPGWPANLPNAGGPNYFNQCAMPAYPGPYTTPVGVVLGTGWTYNLPYRQVEINTTPVAQTDCVFTLQPNDGSLFTVGEKVSIGITGFMQAGTMTVLLGGQSIAVNISAAQWNAAVALPPGLGMFRVNVAVPSGATAKTVTLRFPSGALAQAQMKAVTVWQDYADFPDYAGNTALMSP